MAAKWPGWFGVVRVFFQLNKAVYTVTGDADLEEVFLGSTAARAHLHSAVAQKKTVLKHWANLAGGGETKIHIIGDVLGNSWGFKLTRAEPADISQVSELLDRVNQPDAMIADKGYDSDALVEDIECTGALAVIPPRRNCTAPMVQRSLPESASDRKPVCTTETISPSCATI